MQEINIIYLMVTPYFIYFFLISCDAFDVRLTADNKVPTVWNVFLAVLCLDFSKFDSLCDQKQFPKHISIRPYTA